MLKETNPKEIILILVIDDLRMDKHSETDGKKMNNSTSYITIATFSRSHQSTCDCVHVFMNVFNLPLAITSLLKPSRSARDMRPRDTSVQ